MPQSDNEPLLDTVAREAGDPGLFPDDVRRLHAEGRARRARKLLLEHAKTERNTTRAEKQLRFADDLRLWLEPIKRAPSMYTLNGFGTRLVGEYQPADDGTYVATLWIALLFLPVWPLTAYLVQPAEQGKGWHFFARAALPPKARRMRRVTGIAVAVLTAWLAWTVYWTGAHTDLYVFNGFDRPVIAQVGAQRSMVLPRKHAVFGDLPLQSTTVAASWQDEDKPFETLDVNLAHHGRHTALYNVADRAVLSVDYVVYGEGEPPAGRWLERGPVLFLDERIDYLFATPPDSKSVSEGSSIRNSVLAPADEGVDVDEVVMALFNMDRGEQALAVAKAELLVHPEDGQLLAVTLQTVLQDDFDAQVALARSSLERAPNAVDVHRAYQDLWPAGRRDALRQEYATLLAAHPRSPMHHYLVGRLAEDGSDEAASHYNAALALDRAYAPVFRALGYHEIVRGRWVEALAQYERFARVGAEEAREALDARLRILRRLGRPRAEQERVLAQTAARLENPVSLTVLGAHLRLDQDPRALTTEERRVLAVLETCMGRESTSPLARNVRADLAVTAGDVARARRTLREIEQPIDRSARVALRIAAGDRGTPDDLALLLAITGWQTELGPAQRLVALPLLDSARRGEVIETLDADLTAVARLLVNPQALVSTERLTAALAREPLEVRSAASFAAARALARSTAPGAADARRTYMAAARALALPGELP
jgi:tetratricopeptide (TPR) repeat protein